MKQTSLCPYPLFPTSFFSAIRASIVFFFLLTGSMVLTSCGSSKFSFVDDTPATLLHQEDFDGKGFLMHADRDQLLLITQQKGDRELTFHFLDDKLRTVRSFEVELPEHYKFQHTWKISDRNVLVLALRNDRFLKKFRMMNVDIVSGSVTADSDMNSYSLPLSSKVTVAFSPDSSVFAYCEWEEHPEAATTMLIDIFDTGMRKIRSVRQSYGNPVQGGGAVFDLLVNNESELVIARSALQNGKNLLLVEYFSSADSIPLTTKIVLPPSIQDTSLSFRKSAAMMKNNDEVVGSGAILSDSAMEGLVTFRVNYRTGAVISMTATEFDESDITSSPVDSVKDVGPHTIMYGKDSTLYVLVEMLSSESVLHGTSVPVSTMNGRVHYRNATWYRYITTIGDIMMLAYDKSGNLLWKNTLVRKMNEEHHVDEGPWERMDQRFRRYPFHRMLGSSVSHNNTDTYIFYRKDETVYAASVVTPSSGSVPAPHIIPLVSLPGELTFKHLDYQNVLWQADGSAVMIGHGVNTSRVMQIALP